MPIHEYQCRGCGHRFEALVRGTNRAACPSCQGEDLEQLLSMFAVSSQATRQSALQSARERQKKVQRDKLVADREEAEHHHH
jgi:putative FmdB family regulatory protein